MIISTPRLKLRELELSDAAALNEIDRDERVTRYLPYDPRSPDETAAYLAAAATQQSQLPRRVYDFAIVLESTKSFVGRCGLGIERSEHREAMLWYVLHPAHWGNGYARESATVVLDLAFGALALHRVYADCDPRNTASCRLAERLGMKAEARLRENYFLKGEWCDSSIYGMLDWEWRSRER